MDTVRQDLQIKLTALSDLINDAKNTALLWELKALKKQHPHYTFSVDCGMGFLSVTVSNGRAKFEVYGSDIHWTNAKSRDKWVRPYHAKKFIELQKIVEFYAEKDGYYYKITI